MPTGRIVASLAIIAAAFVASSVIDPTSMLVLGSTAGSQLSSTDSGFVSAFAWMQTFKAINTILTVTVIVALLCVWFPYIKRAVAGLGALLLVCMLMSPAHAFWSQTNTT